MKTETKKVIRRLGLCLCAAAFLVLLLMVSAEQTAGADELIARAFYRIRSEALTAAAVVITYMSDEKVIIGGCIVLLIIPRTRMSFGLPLSAGALALTGVNHLVKAIVLRPRPEEMYHLVEETGLSFPSGHASNSVFFYGLAIYLIRTRITSRPLANGLTAVCAGLMILIGPTRIYLGVHYPTDVLAGWCIGLLTILAEIEILEYIQLRKNRKGETL